MQSLDVGTIVGGKYRLSRALGEGAMGSVWAAVHEVLGREVAIKFLRQSFEDAITARERFAAEAKAAALVKHRFVVDVFDFGVTEGGAPYMVQELLQGRPLSDLLTEGPAWSIRDAVKLMMDCLSGLSAVHERGIIHRDLKPENIFVIPEVEGSVPKLLDFGISKSATGSMRSPKRPSLRAPGRGRLTAVGAVLGTPAYMSPEQLRNLNTLDARADLYSLGVVFYEWLAGHCPYASNTNFTELVETIEAYAMEPLAFLRPDIGDGLCAVVSRALEPDPEKRYASASEMRSALAKLLPTLPDAMTRVQQEEAAPPVMQLPPLRMPQISVPQPKISIATPSLPSLSLAPGSSLAPGMSLQPAGLRRGPSWKVWSGIAVVVGLTLGMTLAVRSLSSQAVPRVQAAPAAKPAAAPAMKLPSAEPAAELPAQDEPLPFGALPPENVPDQELSAPSLSNVVPPERKHKPEPAPRAARPAAQPSEPAPQPRAAEPAPNPRAAPESDKLMRSLDF